MKKNEILKSYKLDRLDDNTVFINSIDFQFAYFRVKEESNARYYGGLQCNLHRDSINYKNLEKWLIELAEQALGIKKSN